MHGKTLALPFIDGRTVNAQEPEPAAKESSNAALGECGPVARKLRSGDRAIRAKQQSLDIRVRGYFIERVDGDLSGERAHIYYGRRPKERFERKLVRTRPTVANVKRRIRVSADVRARRDG